MKSITSYIVVDLIVDTFKIAKKYTNELIEISALKIVDGEIADTFNQSRKVLAIDPAITQFYDVSPARYVDAPEISATELVSVFLDFAGNLPIVAHNANNYHKVHLTNNAEELQNDFIDTMELLSISNPFDTPNGLSLGALRQSGVVPGSGETSLDKTIHDVHVLFEALKEKREDVSVIHEKFGVLKQACQSLVNTATMPSARFVDWTLYSNGVSKLTDTQSYGATPYVVYTKDEVDFFEKKD